MENILLTTNWNLSNRHVESLILIMESYYKELKDEYNVYLLTKLSTESRVLSAIKKHGAVKICDHIIHTNKMYDHASDVASWREFSDKIDVSHLPKFSRVIEVGSAISHSTLNPLKITYESLFENYNGHKMNVVNYMMNHLCCTARIASYNECVLEHYVFDPLEFNYNLINEQMGFAVKRVGFYTSEIMDFEFKDVMNRIYPSTEKYTENNEYDFTFGYTSDSHQRKNLGYEFIDEIDNMEKCNVFVLDKTRKIDTFKPRNEYLQYIKKSKYTLMIPSHAEFAFSAIRFIESIHYGCIPLILDTNFLDEIRQSYYVPECLVVKDVADIKNKLESLDYHKIISDLIESNLLKDGNNKDLDEW